MTLSRSSSNEPNGEPWEPSFSPSRLDRAWLSIGSPAKHPWLDYGWAVASVLLCTLVDAFLFGRIDEPNVIMVYLLGLLPVALRGNGGAAVTAAVLDVAAFDWFFVPPYYTFAVSDTQYLFTFLVMGLVGTLLSTLTTRLSAEIAATRQRELRAHALYSLSRSVLAARHPDEILAEGAKVLRRDLGLSLGAWLPGPDGEPQSVLEPGSPLSASEHEVLRWALREGLPAGPGTATFPGLAHLFLPIASEQRVLGAIAIPLLGPEPAWEPEARAMLETGANQIAVALEQARSREEADAARAQAETERMRSALLSSVSHDLRTPLTGIVGAAGTLCEGAEALAPDIRRELAAGIVEEAERLNRLVTNLLHATRLDAGEPRLSREWISIEDILSPVLERLEPRLKGHPLHVELPADLPLMHVDAVLLDQVFANLLENVVKHTPSGTHIWIRAGRESQTMWIDVLDDGPGLLPGSEEQIFEKFRRFSREGAPGGAGLGLAICKGVLEAHGGRIFADNRPEGGARFRLVLPLTPAPTGPLKG